MEPQALDYSEALAKLLEMLGRQVEVTLRGVGRKPPLFVDFEGTLEEGQPGSGHRRRVDQETRPHRSRPAGARARPARPGDTPSRARSAADQRVGTESTHGLSGRA